MEKWKVFSAHENVVLGRALTLVAARIIALEWAASAGRLHHGYVPGWIVDTTDSIITVIYREERVAVCQRDDSKFHMQLPCMCEDRITSLDDRKLPR